MPTLDDSLLPGALPGTAGAESRREAIDNLLPTFVVLATAVDTVVVTFSEPMVGNLGVPSAWAIGVRDGVADAVAPSAAVVAEGADEVVLTVEPRLTPGGLYRVTIPADAADVAGNVPSPVYGDFVVAVGWPAAPVREGLLEAMLGALGDELARLVGTPRTRLTAPMAADATVADVESTLGFAASGQAYIGNRLVTYTGLLGARLVGLAHEQVEGDDGTLYPLHRDALPIGTPVEDANRQWSLRDQAKACTMIERCPESFLPTLGRDMGFGRPLAEMTVQDYRDYLTVQNYLPRGTWQSVYRVLRPMLRWASLTGTDGRVVEAGGVLWLECPSLVTSRPHDRWIIVRGRWCRVREARRVAGLLRLRLESTDGPQWQAHDLAVGMTGVSWEMLAFRVSLGRGGSRIGATGTETGFERAGVLNVSLFLLSPVPSTFLMGTPTISTDGRTPAGIVRADYTAESVDVWPWFLLTYPKRPTTEVLSDVVPATTFVNVKVLAP